MKSLCRVVVPSVVALVGAMTPVLATSPSGGSTAGSPMYYMALGASLVTGAGSTGGADYVNDLGTWAQQGIPGLQVENLGCSGATTTAVINGGDCVSKYTTGTQLGDAEAFLESHPGQVAYVTVDIGADDVLGCASGGTIDVTCFDNGLAKVEQNLPTILSGLRAAGGSVPIEGIDYYDPFLEFWLNGSSGQQAAQESVGLLDQLNSVLNTDYAQYGVVPADASNTFATTNWSLTGTWNGTTVPANVGIICAWTNMCTSGGTNVHTNNTGYAELADTFEQVIDVPLAVTLNPANQTTTAGGSLTVNAAAVGLPPPAVTWQVSENGGTSWSTVSGWTLRTETTPAISASENGWELRAVFTNANGSILTSPATLTVTAPTTSVLLPSGAATVSGPEFVLDAASSPGVTSVIFELSGNGLQNEVVATGTPTLYGWLAEWNTTGMANGTYTLNSVATGGGLNGTSQAINVTVSNPPPTTSVVLPATGATVSGTQSVLDAVATSGVSSVTYQLSGNGLNNSEVATGTPTLYGWLAEWNSTTVPNGTYTLTSVAAYAGGVSGTSQPITVTVKN